MTTKSVAEERLLDIALEEAIAGRQATSPRRAQLLVAALFLCGIGVVATLLWQHRATATSTPVQEPQRAPLPAPVVANSSTELTELPVDTVNLEARFASPAEFAGLRRFRDLRRLRILLPMKTSEAFRALTAPARSARDTEAATAARFADATQFAPLGELHTLEALELPHDVVWTPEHFAFLRNLQLADFGIAVIDLRTQPMIEALLAAPTFRRLHLFHARIGAEFFRALQPLQLEQLELRRCQGFDDAAWAAIAHLRTLQRLEVTHVSGGRTHAFDVTHPGGTGISDEMIDLAPFADAAFDAFAALPGLRQLRLRECEFPGDLLARLPVSLTSLDLGSRPNTFGDVRSLRRLTNLRSLTIRFGDDDAQAAAAVLSSWHLERLDYRGIVHRGLMETIAEQPHLTELVLRVGTRTDLAPLANAAQLRSLDLFDTEWNIGAPGIRLAQLESLAACTELRTLRLQTPRVDERAVRELFGDRVAIEVITKLVTTL